MPERVERAEVAQFNKKRQAEFAENYKKAGEALRASAHCLSYEMTQCMGDPDFYTLRMRVGRRRVALPVGGNFGQKEIGLKVLEPSRSRVTFILYRNLCIAPERDLK